MANSNKSNNKRGSLHPGNPHQGRYDFAALTKTSPGLLAYVIDNPKGDSTIDFADSAAVKCLNQALLAHYYQVKLWQIPDGYLCPPIPGRADHIHHLNELLAGDIKADKPVRVLDIGTGANCIYPIIGSQTFGWRFVATDIDMVSVNVAKTIVEHNPCLRNKIKVVLQTNPEDCFAGVITPRDYFDLSMCNPPFHASEQEARASNERKVNNLAKAGSRAKPGLNFGGQQNELWCPGGELAFIERMITQSVEFAEQVGWFSTLVSKVANLDSLKATLKQHQVAQVKVIKMSQGQKISHILAWRFTT